ncbi:MAG: class I SAM-dependent methyltransferase [Dehalococcoidia bacterium]
MLPLPAGYTGDPASIPRRVHCGQQWPAPLLWGEETRERRSPRSPAIDTEREPEPAAEGGAEHPLFESVPCPVCGDATNVRVIFDAVERGRVVRCRRCDLGFVSPRPVSTIGLYTDPSYFGESDSEAHAGYLAYDEDSNVMHTYFERAARDLAERAGRGRLLEVGCANGSFLRAARDAGFEVQGVEPGDGAALVARAAGLPVLTGTLDDPSIEAGAWDVIVLMQTMEHLPEPQAALDRLLALLRPGGLLMMTTPNQHSWLARVSGARWVEYKPPEHLFLFTPRTIRALLGRAGFEQVEVAADVHRYPPRWVVRRLGRYFPVTRPLVALAERLLPAAILDRTLPVYYGSMRILARRPLV